MALVLLRILALVLAALICLGYGWFDRSYLSVAGKVFFLSPAIALLAIAMTPVRVNPTARWLVAALCLLGVTRLAVDIVADIALSDSPAVMFRLLVAAVLVLALYLRHLQRL